MRLGLVVAAALATTRLLTVCWASAWSRVAGPGPASADELLALGASSLAIGVAGWLVCGAGLAFAAHLPGRLGRSADRWARRVTPAVARRAAGLVLGVGVGVVGGPAQAVASGPPVTVAVDASASDGRHAPDPGFRVTVTSTPVTATPTASTPVTATAPPPPSTDPAPVTTSDPVAPGFTPAPPRVRPQADPGLLGARAIAAPADEVVVHRGDSLWSIAARHLGPDASAAEVDRSWREWFSLNRDTVGEDPDLILPGQVLRVPGQSTSVVR